MKPHFNGHIRYDVICKARVCNPVQGTVVKATVKNKNQLGIIAESVLVEGEEVTPILDIIVPRRWAGIASEIDVDDIDIGQTINVEVLGKRYQLKDTKISIIGRIVKEVAIVEPDEDVAAEWHDIDEPVVDDGETEDAEDEDVTNDDDEAPEDELDEESKAKVVEDIKNKIKSVEIEEDDGEEDDDEDDEDDDEEDDEDDDEDREDDEPEDD
jgi:hypothetical protein